MTNLTESDNVMSKTKNTYCNRMIWASGFYLSKTLPDNWEKDDEIDEFVEANAWQPFEGWTASNIWSEIASLASSAQDFFGKKG